MKPTTCGQWCHIVCAIACPEVQFVDKTKRGPIDIRLLNPARRKLVVLILVFVFVFFCDIDSMFCFRTSQNFSVFEGFRYKCFF